MLKKVLVSVYLALAMLGIGFAGFEGDVYIAGVSRYLWRGQELNHGFAIQPGFDLGCGPVSLGFWGSYHADSGNFAEADFTLSTAYSPLELVELSGGYTFYTFPQPVYGDSHEVFLGAGFSVLLSPSLTAYYDFDDGDGLYAELGASYPFSLGADFSLDGSLGYNAGQWGYDSSLTVFGLSLSAVIPAGKFEITPLIFGQIRLDEQYSNDGFGSLSVSYNF